jgi:hypothetical protein
MKGREMIALQFRPRSDAAFAEDASTTTRN